MSRISAKVFAVQVQGDHFTAAVIDNMDVRFTDADGAVVQPDDERYEAVLHASRTKLVKLFASKK